jgi:hypothetical protein
MTGKLLTVLLLFSLFAKAQQNPALVDSLKLKLAKAKTTEERIDILGDLSRI